MTTDLPLEVLGLMAPLLCWVEGAEGVRLPEPWLGDELTVEDRVTAWLIRELPTYSRDHLEELQQLARRREGTKVAGLPRHDPRHEGLRRLQHRRAHSFLDPPTHYDLRDAFDRLADRYFTWMGNELCILDGRVEELHELALRFPVRHLIRYRHARAVATGLLPPEQALGLPEEMNRLHTTSRGLRAVVERGLTEGHLHLKGVASANEAWADHLLNQLAPGATRKFGRAEERLLVMARASVRLLALGLLHASLGLDGRELPFHAIPLLDQLYTVRPDDEERLRYALRLEVRGAVRSTPAPRGRHLRIHRRELDWILELLDPAAHFAHFGTRPQVRRGSDAGVVGIRRRIRRLERLHFTVQRLLIEMDLPGSARSADSPFLGLEGFETGADALLWQFLHDVFYRYLVLNTHHWHLGTQSGRTTGLLEFKRFYDSRQRKLVAADDLDVQGLVFERLRSSSDLREVEGRISPPDSVEELVPWVLSYAEAAERSEIDRFGIVIHFLKAQKGEASDEPEPGHSAGEAAWHRRAGMSRSAGPLRHGRIRRITRRRALGLFQLLSEPHPAVPFVVGIDAANLELTTPPEVFAPAFNFLLEFPIALSPRPALGRWTQSHQDIVDLVADRRLGMTYHVGEDFRHILSGLRAIAEVIDFLRPRPGDRLGHAIALALDPEVWASQIGYQAVVPRQEALDTLVWMGHFLGPGHDLLGELGVEDWIQQLGRQIYEPGRRAGSPREAGLPSLDLTPQTLYDAWRLRQLDPALLDPEGLQAGIGRLLDVAPTNLAEHRWRRVRQKRLLELDRRIGSSDAYRILGQYWYQRRVREEGAKLVPVEMRGQQGRWLDLCHEVQEKLRREIERRQIVIEVNPSSNRVIGPMSGFSEHHVFRLTLDDDHRPVKQIRVTINTDDPGVFNTSLAHEYYLLAENLLRRGVPEPRVVEWLEWLRCNGNDYSFVRNLGQQKNRERLKRLLKDLREANRALAPRLAGTARELRLPPRSSPHSDPSTTRVNHSSR